MRGRWAVVATRDGSLVLRTRRNGDSSIKPFYEGASTYMDTTQSELRKLIESWDAVSTASKKANEVRPFLLV